MLLLFLPTAFICHTYIETLHLFIYFHSNLNSSFGSSHIGKAKSFLVSLWQKLTDIPKWPLPPLPCQSAVCIIGGPGNFKLNNYHLTTLKGWYHCPWPRKQRWFSLNWAHTHAHQHTFKHVCCLFPSVLFIQPAHLRVIFRVRLCDSSRRTEEQKAEKIQRHECRSSFVPERNVEL